MKRRDLIRHLQKNGCRFVREGGEHSIWENPAAKRRSAVPRHREIPEHTVARICKQLEIPGPS
jgi:predicted RNA binding protein YcfA (HicA-like mRNA interferase family)